MRLVRNGLAVILLVSLAGCVRPQYGADTGQQVEAGSCGPTPYSSFMLAQAAAAPRGSVIQAIDTFDSERAETPCQ